MKYPKLRDILAIINGSTVVSVVVVDTINDDDGSESHTRRIWRGFPEYVSVSKLEKMGAHVVTHMMTAGGDLILYCQKEEE